MKAKKRILIYVLAVLMIFSLSGCSKGEDLIKYNNSKRDAVIKEYVGDKVNVKGDPTDKIASRSYTADDNDTYNITIENIDDDYFFNGVVKFKFGSQRVNVNVKMLAPGYMQYFTVKLKEAPVSYTYDAVGNFYDWSDASEIDIDFSENEIDNYDEQVVLDIDAFNDDIAEDLAKHFYSYDTLFNYDAAATYYLVTYADYNAGYDYNYIMIVDTLHQKVTFKDVNNAIVKTVTF